MLWRSDAKLKIYEKMKSNMKIQRTRVNKDYTIGVNELLPKLDDHLGVLLVSNFEYPGRYARFDLGFINPPLQIVTKANNFIINALNQRGELLLSYLVDHIKTINNINCDLIANSKTNLSAIRGYISPSNEIFPEELRSKQPSVFTLLRELMRLFNYTEDECFGLYGAFGYDVAFQFEKINLKLERQAEQRDIVLFIPDQLLVVDHRKETAIEYSYDFTLKIGSAELSTHGLKRDGNVVAYIPSEDDTIFSDHSREDYIQIVETAKDYFKRGDLFEVVPGRTFFNKCLSLPSTVFNRLRIRNPSPYGFIMNLGENEYLVGASPEMYVRVNGKRVETCPISGTIKRGHDALEDAANILTLLNSKKDESELTMCTDVDRNDKSRVCLPGSVKVIGRRQLELYSRLIHTVDHVEGILKDGYDALDAFLTHTWAVTVTGAPKKWAMQFVEDHEKSPRLWYGGAIGYIGFDGNMNTGLTIRTVRIKNGVSEVRAGATLLYDSIPAEEEAETCLKASAMLDAINNDAANNLLKPLISCIGNGKKALLVDHQDSFVHTLANYFRQTGMEVITLRNGFSEEYLAKINPDLVVLSPGPGRPDDFNLKNTIAMSLKLNLPIFGVCLGLQGVVEYFGGSLATLDYPMHGKKVNVTTIASKIFAGLDDKFTVGLYHSLYADKATFPSQLNVIAQSESGIIMGVEHKDLPIYAVQFHPESILTLDNAVGQKIVENMVKIISKK